MIENILIPVAYLVSAVLFILGLKGLTRVRTARRGNMLGALAMFIAIITTLVELGSIDYKWILIGLVVGGGIGAFAALKVEMTSMPEMVALLNGFGGGASALVASSVLYLEIIEPQLTGTPATPSSVRTKLPLSERPGPFFFSDLSAKASSLKAEILCSPVSASKV